MHRNALQFAAEQLAGFRRGGARSGCIGFGSHAKHGAVIAAYQIGITEAGAGENIPQQRFIIRAARRGLRGRPLPQRRHIPACAGGLQF